MIASDVRIGRRIPHILVCLSLMAVGVAPATAQEPQAVPVESETPPAEAPEQAVVHCHMCGVEILGVPTAFDQEGPRPLRSLRRQVGREAAT